MITRFEADRTGEHQRLVSHRSQANYIVSDLIQIAEKSPCAPQIWIQVERDFIRLAESPTRDIRLLTPQGALRAARESEWRRIKDVAEEFQRDPNDINRYRGLLGAALTLSLQKEGLILDPHPTVNQAKYEQLRQMHKEADTIAVIIEEPKFGRQLALMPDLKALLLSFQQYSTTRIFLRENGAPYNPRDIRFFNSDLKDYLFGSDISRIGLLLRRVTFSRWINNHISWYGSSESEVDEMISESAAFVSSRKFSKGRENRARRLKWFLHGIVARELLMAQEDLSSSSSQPYSLSDMFSPLDGRPINTISDVDLGKTFKLFANSSACPESIKSVVYKYLGFDYPPKTYAGLALLMYKDLEYAPETKKRWIEGGFTFLENVLLRKPEDAPSWRNLTIDRRAMLRKFRVSFQKALSKHQRNLI